MISASEPHKELERPLLCLGLTGFSPQQRAGLEAAVALPYGGWPIWRVGPFWEADAWWVNGTAISLQSNGDLRVLAGQPIEQALNLKLEEVDRPIAFSTPLASRSFEPAITFDPASDASLHRALQRFNVWLQPLLFRSALGALILRGGTDLRGGIYHVRNKETLLAVLDFRRGKGAILPNALPIDLKETVWDKRPDGAHDLPESFLRCTPAQMVWTHARHTARDLLPPRYRTEILYYRRPPRVPMGWLRDSMLQLLSALSAAPGVFKDLRERTGIPVGQMASDLACLYYAGAITTTAFKATGASFSANDKPSARVTLQDFDALHGGSTMPPITSEPTAPAMLYETPLSSSGR